MTLGGYKDIMELPADKYKYTVVQDRVDYITKCQKI